MPTASETFWSSVLREVANSKRTRRPRLDRGYDLTPEQQLDYFDRSQTDNCEICQRPASDSHRGVLALDHDHETGKVRGLLCGACNKALGFFQDDIDVMAAAIEYIKRSRA